MGDRLRAGKPPRYVTSHLGQLSRRSLWDRKIEYRPDWLGWRRGVLTCVGWKVTLCDPISQVTLRSCEMVFHEQLYQLYLYLYHGVEKHEKRRKNVVWYDATAHGTKQNKQITLSCNLRRRKIPGVHVELLKHWQSCRDVDPFVDVTLSKEHCMHGPSPGRDLKLFIGHAITTTTITTRYHYLSIRIM